MDLETTNTISSFSSIGLTDPKSDKKGIKLALREMESLLFEDEVYKDIVITSTTKPPKSIFLPSKELCRTMIKAVL